MSYLDDDTFLSLSLANDLCNEHERAETWKQMAVLLASVLRDSWTSPHSIKNDALDAFKDLLKSEQSLKV
jgi:hypothetical protein